MTAGLTSRDMVSGRGIPTYETARAGGQPARSPGDLRVPGLSGNAQWSTVPPGQPNQPT